MDNKTITQIEKQIGYRFNNQSLLVDAFTHPSYEKRTLLGHYQRLEFIGDSVLNLIVTTELYKRLPNEPEGELSKRRAHIVCKQSCFDYCKTLDVDRYIRAQDGILTPLSSSFKNILADIFEAILGAIYIDSDIHAAHHFFHLHIEPLIDWSMKRENWKAKLQEYLQQDGAILPQYKTIDESGPEHNKEFTVSVSIDDHSHSEHGSGSSKKEAEQEAAKKLFNYLNNINGS